MPLANLRSKTFNTPAFGKMGWLILLSSLAFIIVWQLPFQTLGNEFSGYAPLHTMLEIFAVVIAGAIFSVGWHTRLNDDKDCLILLGVGFLGVGLLDVAHLLSFEGMPDWITPSGSGKAIDFWFIARYLAAIMLLLFVLGSNLKNFRFRFRFRFRVEYLALLVILFLVLFSVWIVQRHSDMLPVFIIPGQGLTPIKLYFEWGLVLILLSTLVLVWRKHRQSNYFDPGSLMAALWLACISELCFTLYSNAADTFNLMGHIYKVFSYAFLYHAIVVGSIKMPYQLLSQSQEILQQITDNVNQVFWVSTPDKQEMLYMSPAYESIWKKSLDSVMKSPMSWYDDIHPDDKERVNNYLKAQKKNAGTIDYRIVRPDGTIRMIRSRTFPIHNNAGVVIRIAGIAEDVTEQAESRAALQKKERLLQQTQSISHLGSWEYDIAKDSLIWTDEVYHILGVDPEITNISYQFFLDHIHPDDRRYVDNCYTDSIKNNLDSYECEHRVVRDNTEEVRYVLEKCNHIRDNNGNIVRSIGLIHDITEQKMAESEQRNLQSQLIQAQKMEAIGHLTGGIAHDFNNMLGAILGYAELLKIKQKTISKDKQSRYINEILIAGNRAKELISQMLIFSSLKPGSDDNITSDILIKPILKEVMHLLRLSIASTIEINYQIESDDLMTHINPVQLHQILMNLAINARDACGEYGRIDINISKRMMSGACSACHESYNKQYIVISVQDTGHGIRDEDKDKIFDPFFTTKEVGKGTGMGLSVVHGMVHSQGGHINVKPGPNNIGTVFEILLPPSINGEETTPSPETSIDEGDNISDKLHGLNVMVVDDEVSVANFLSELLQLHGANVRAYHDPILALTSFGDHPESFDIVITDETMPRFSGSDMSRSMLTIKPALPIILCTGYSEKINDKVVQETGIAKLMFKPIDSNELLENILMLTQGHA